MCGGLRFFAWVRSVVVQRLRTAMQARCRLTERTYCVGIPSVPSLRLNLQLSPHLHSMPVLPSKPSHPLQSLTLRAAQVPCYDRPNARAG